MSEISETPLGRGYTLRESSANDAKAFEAFRDELTDELRVLGGHYGLGIPNAGAAFIFTIDHLGVPIGVVGFQNEYLTFIFVNHNHRRTGVASTAIAVLIERHFARAHAPVQANARTPAGRALLTRLGFTGGILDYATWVRTRRYS